MPKAVEEARVVPLESHEQTPIRRLPAPLRGGKEALSREGRKEIQSFIRRRPARFLLELGLAWTVIALAVGAAVTLDNPWVSAAAIFVVATRQNVFALLVHEQVHGLGLRPKWGDWVVNFLAAYPLIGLTVEGYAGVHLSHHRYYFSKNDPDFLRKSGRDWAIPQSVGRLLKLAVADVLGVNFLRFTKGKRLTRKTKEFQRPNSPPWPVRLGYYGLLAGMLTWFEGWSVFLLYWVVPLLTVLQLLVRLGALTEHQYNLAGAKVEETTPLILLPWWQKLLVPNLNFTYHVYHHFFPGVSFSDLPRVHRVFEREGLVEHANLFHGYGDFLRTIVRQDLRTSDEMSPVFDSSTA